MEKGYRHQIAHLQLVDPVDFPRFKELGVVADMQFEWAKRELATEGPLGPYLGPERYRYVYPSGSLHAAGATIAGGSDWDVPRTTRSAPFKPPSLEPAVREVAPQHRGAHSAHRDDRRLHHQRRLRHKAGRDDRQPRSGKAC